MSFSSDPLDLGHGHIGSWVSWAPDRDLNPQYDGVPSVERYGLLIKHAKPDGNPCMGSVTFASETAKKVSPDTATWDVESWAPLSLSPSILCSCGDHGWIRDGRWVPA